MGIHYFIDNHGGVEQNEMTLGVSIITSEMNQIQHRPEEKTLILGGYGELTFAEFPFRCFYR